jgi:pimeloyl-ACP methyl ester carboxylesterase
MLALFVLLNAVACTQARAATHFVADGAPLEALIAQPLPQQLGALLTGVRIPRPLNRATPAEHYLPYETRAIGLPNGEQLEAWYVPQPQPRGIALMFVGYAGVKEGALTPAAKLYQWGYSSLLVDFRGVGGSSRNDQTLGIREAEDVAAAFAYARAEWPELPVVLYGVSMGGAAILRAAAVADVRPAGIILEAVFDNLLSTTRHRFDALGLPGSPAAELLLFWGGVQLGANPFAHNPAEYAARVDVPALLLYGEQDPWIVPHEREALAGALRGPVELVSFPGQGHGGPYVYGDPEHWDAAVRAFLDRL